MANAMANESIFTNFKRDLQTLNYAELNYLISDIMLEIKKRSYNEGMVKAMTSGISAEETTRNSPKQLIDEIVEIATRKSPQQIRDEIVEKAKRDVAGLKVRMEDEHMDNYGGNSTWRCWVSKVNFVVNSEKRTIVALVFAKSGKHLLEKGIAKCDPSDCFNVHIGKAIALRRALGLEVPSEYYNAPQPTEVRVGDVVKSLISGTTGTALESEEGKYTLNQNGVYYTLAHSACNVVDDSREGSEGNGEEV